jgi:hypothetical protein
MLQNRVDPFGNIFRTPARGAWMGNRGVIHDEHKHIRKPFRTRAWITCVLQFKGRRRQVMTPRRWTELFFLDEATAFAAGHRPCFECRRQDALRFKTCWIKGNPVYGFDNNTPMDEIDRILHRERIDSNGRKLSYEALLQDLPDGAFIEMEGSAWLVTNDLVHEWTPFGYEKKIALSPQQPVSVLTPGSVVNAFRAGYLPQIHSI